MSTLAYALGASLCILSYLPIEMSVVARAVFAGVGLTILLATWLLTGL